MARQFNITGNNIRLASAVGSGTLAIFVQFRLLDLSAVSHTLAGVYEATDHNGLRVDVNSGLVAAVSRASGIANSAGTLAPDVVKDIGWHCALAQFAGSASRTIRFDNSAIYSNAVSNTPGALTKTVIGARDANGVISQELGHEIARVAMWNASDIMDAEYYAMLAGAPCADVRLDSLVTDVDLTGDVFDYYRSAWVITGTAVVDNPPPPVKPWFVDRMFAPTAASTFNASWNAAANTTISSGALAA